MRDPLRAVRRCVTAGQDRENAQGTDSDPTSMLTILLHGKRLAVVVGMYTTTRSRSEPWTSDRSG
jgi:hypothetical protein